MPRIDDESPRAVPPGFAWLDCSPSMRWFSDALVQLVHLHPCSSSFFLNTIPFHKWRILASLLSPPLSLRFFNFEPQNSITSQFQHNTGEEVAFFIHKLVLRHLKCFLRGPTRHSTIAVYRLDQCRVHSSVTDVGTRYSFSFAWD